MSNIESLVSTLSNLQLGEKCWYWFCQESTELPLLMLPFSADGGLKALMAQANEIKLPLGANVRSGIASVSSTGALQFGGHNLGQTMLEALASWVQNQVIHHPELAKLSGSEFIQITSTGIVERSLRADEGWRGISRPPAPGQPAHAEQIFTSLGVGDEAMLWMEEESSSAVAVRFGQENSEALFSERIRGTRIRQGIQAAGIKGILLRSPSGELILTTRSDISQVGNKLQDWLSEIGGMRLVQLNADGPPAVTVIAESNSDAVGLERIATAIDAILDEAIFNFFFTPQGVDGQSHLLLEANSKALKQAATELGRPNTYVRGKVKLAKGIFLFRSQQNHTSFLSELADWALANVEHCPQLRQLAGARVIVRDREGNTINRMKNDRLWTTLRN